MTWLNGKWLSFVFVAQLSMVASTTPARSDVAHYYLATSCEETRGIATITTTVVYNDGPAPAHGIHYGDEGSFLLLPHKKIEVCDLGALRRVSLLIWMNGEHPRDDHMDIYIGSRPPLSVYSIQNNITITAMPTKFFVRIKQCSPQEGCSEFIYTNPSFDCQAAREPVEELICSSNKLSELDISLESTWQQLIREHDTGGKLSKRLKSSEITWIKSRAAVCGIPKSHDPYFSYYGAESCLTKLYENRIRELKAFSRNLG